MRKVIDVQTGTVSTASEEGPFQETPTIEMVKDEAQRRINEILPEWKQRNLIAHAAVLAEKQRANWDSDDLAAWTAGELVWAQIKVVRDKSDLLEAMNPIPADYKSDGYWS